MALFTRVQHLCTFKIVYLLIYHLFPNVWKEPYTISGSIFIDVPYWPPYSADKFISCVVPGPSEWFFNFGEENVIARLVSCEYGECFRISHCQRRMRSVITAATAGLLTLLWRMMRCTNKCRRFLLSAGRRRCYSRQYLTSVLDVQRSAHGYDKILIIIIAEMRKQEEGKGWEDKEKAVTS